jgi:replicative superfamily II helicase
MMPPKTNIFYEDEIGSEKRQGSTRLSARAELPESLRKALIAYYGKDILLSPPQEAALNGGIAGRTGLDYLISAPTNSGKTLISLFRIFTSTLAGEKRCVYVAPLKALAEEKAVEFRVIAENLHRSGERRIKVSVTTGDYQLSREFLGSPPPDSGEIVICTPERLEVMLRNPENHEWARAVDTFVFDEFHLLGDSTRGAGMDVLLTRLLLLSDWPSMIFLSATIGNPDKIIQWLSHTKRKVTYIHSDYRYPKLIRRVALSTNPEDELEAFMREIVTEESRSALVFVSSRKDANTLAAKWRTLYPDRHFAAFHAGLGGRERNELMTRIREGAIKGVAATTSLKMGVNFPVTDVIIRDPVLKGKKGTYPLSSSDVSQMMGRAGRGEIPGRGVLISNQEEDAFARREQLSTGYIEDLRPRLMTKRKSYSGEKVGEGAAIRPINGIVLTQIIGGAKVRTDEITGFLKHTYAAIFGGLDAAEVRSSLDFLTRNHLIEPVEGMDGSFQVRPLGRTIAYSGISPESGCIFAGMIRALIKLQKNGQREAQRGEDLISRLTPLDYLFLALSAHECRDYWIKSSDKTAIEEVQTYIEGLPVDEKPLFNRWRREDDKENPTRRLLSTLRIETDMDVEGNASNIFARMMATAILLYIHAKGESLKSLALRYSHAKRQLHEGDLESGLKFSAIWMLSCISQICDPEKAYGMKRVQLRILELIEDVSLGSEMGKLCVISGIASRSVQKLVERGVTNLESLRVLLANNTNDLGLTEAQRISIAQWLHSRAR